MSKNYESDAIHAAALIVSDYSEQYSHWDAAMSLGVWLEQENVPGIYGMYVCMPRSHQKSASKGYCRTEMLLGILVALHPSRKA